MTRNVDMLFPQPNRFMNRYFAYALEDPNAAALDFTLSDLQLFLDYRNTRAFGLPGRRGGVRLAFTINLVLRVPGSSFVISRPALFLPMAHAFVNVHGVEAVHHLAHLVGLRLVAHV